MALRRDRSGKTGPKHFIIRKGGFWLPIYVVIMCGGSGTRFWPASRKSRPKQFLRLGGSASLLQQTAARLEGLVPPERIYLLAAREHADALRRHLPAVPESNYILEPAARNTAPALALAAKVLGDSDPEAVMAALPADHVVTETDLFRECLATAAEAAGRKGAIATLGIKPDSPETGFGYIETGKPLSPSVVEVKRFVEKPSLETARSYLSSGAHLWNAGIFVMRADTLAEQFRKLQPATYRAIWEELLPAGEPGFDEALERVYVQTEAVSIDYAVMERATGVVCVPSSFGWNDLGSWSALEKMWDADEAGNRSDTGYFGVDSRGNIVSGRGRAVALVGVDDLVVVERDDVVLVCAKDRCQDLRKVIELLKTRGREELL